MTNKQVIVGVLAALVLLAGGYAVFSRVAPNAQGLAYEALVKWYGNGFYAGLNQQFHVDSTGIASTSATTESHNGITDTYVRSRMSQSTTTPCALPSPSATSTLISWTVQFERSTTTVSLITLAKATTAFATTTLLGNQIQIATSSEDAIVASTTAAQQKAEAHIFGPSEFAVVGMQLGLNGDPNAAGIFSPLGTCSAHFRSLL